jgi:hypothetical protein
MTARRTIRRQPKDGPPPKLPPPPPQVKKIEDILGDLDFRDELREEAEERAAATKPPAPPTPAPQEPIVKAKETKDEAGTQMPAFLSVAASTSNGVAHGPDEDEDEDEDEDFDDDDEDDDLDDEDLDEDEDDDLEDEDDEPAARKAPARKAPARKAPARKAPTPRGRAMPMENGFTPSFSPSPSAPAVRLPPRIQQARIEQNLNEYDEMLASIDFDASKNHKILLTRVKPEWDVASGRRLAGYLEEFRRPVTPEEIRAKYGGGEYMLILQGPSAPDGTGRTSFKKSKSIEISGDPIIHGATPAQRKEDSNKIDLVQQVLEAKEKDTQRLWAEQQEMKKLLLQTMSKNDNGIKDVVATALTGGGDLRRELMEERRLQEERIRAEREERQRELDRLATERKRELEMAQVQHDKQLEILRMQNERQLEQMRLENQRIMEEMRQRTTSESSASRDLLLFMQRMEAEKAATVQKQQELFLSQQQRQQELATAQATKQQEFLLQQQMQGQQMLLAQMQSAQQTKEQFLLEMLKESRNKKDDFFSTMEKMQQFKKMMGAMNGEEEDTRERWEKVLDRVGEAAPGIVAVASSFIQSRQAQAQQAQQAQAAPPQQQRVLPGSVAVAEVELPPPQQVPQLPPRRAAPPPAPPTKKQKKPSSASSASSASASSKPAPKPAPKPAAPPAPSVTSTVLEATQPVAEGANPLTDFTLPPDGMGIADAIPLLVQNIDLAIQRDMSAQQIYEEVVSKFPIEVLTVLKLASADQMIEILEQRAPGSWIINSLVGTQKIEALHELLVAG